jgi:hypothetical protein
VADIEEPSDDAVLGAIARHALHDEELVAAFAADELDDTSEVARARILVERCVMCRDLCRDLTVIRTVIRASGTAAERAATASAPRDFRLSADDAARLRPGTPIERVATRLGLRARLGRGIVAFGRPLGAALATFGIAGLLLGSVTLNAGLHRSRLTGAGAGASAVPAAEQYPPTPQATGDLSGFLPLDSGIGGEDGEYRAAGRDVLEAGPLSVVLIAGGGALLVLGVALIIAARRNLTQVISR